MIVTLLGKSAPGLGVLEPCSVQLDSFVSRGKLFGPAGPVGPVRPRWARRAREACWPTKEEAVNLMQSCPWEIEGFEAVYFDTRLPLADSPRQARSEICPTSLLEFFSSTPTNAPIPPARPPAKTQSAHPTSAAPLNAPAPIAPEMLSGKRRLKRRCKWELWLC